MLIILLDFFAYSGGMFGRVIKIGQKNFGIEDVVQQNIDIGYIANALKLLDANQSADIIKIDRPVNLDGFAKDIFDRHNITKVELIVAGYQALLDHYGPQEQQNNE